MNIEISKISATNDGRLNVHPAVTKPMFQYVYREAAGVYWNEELGCFQSSSPNNWDSWAFDKWYVHIVSTVRSGLGERLKLLQTTVFDKSVAAHESAIRSADAEIQKWIDEN